MSQKDEILTALQKGEALTRMDCLMRFGCAKAPARIAELRQSGWPIETEIIESSGKRFARWRMKEAGEDVRHDPA